MIRSINTPCRPAQSKQAGTVKTTILSGRAGAGAGAGGDGEVTVLAEGQILTSGRGRGGRSSSRLITLSFSPAWAGAIVVLRENTCNEVISSPLLYLQVKMVTTTWPLVLCSLLSLSLDQSWSTDPLLLEYSDYYYDLYYGDYDDYNFRAGQ